MQIGEKRFPDGEAAKHFVRGLLAKYPMGSRVGEPEDHAFLLELVKRHPDFRNEWLDDLESIEVVRNRRKRATELRLVRAGGTATQVGWVHCF